MKATTILLVVLCIVMPACTSHDEPEPEFTGPWEIEYVESYVGWHTSNPDFETWFQSHTNNFVSADFANYSQTQRVNYTKANGDWIEWEDYNKWYFGIIEWTETIYDATEIEIKSKVDAFKNYSSDDGTPTGKCDIFDARYRKQPK